MRVPDEAGFGKAKVTVSFPGWKGDAVIPTTFEVPVLNPEQHLRLKRETILKSLKELEKENGRQYEQIKRAWQQELEQMKRETVLKSLKELEKQNRLRYEQTKRARQQELEQIEATLKSLKPDHKEPLKESDPSSIRKGSK